MGGTGNNCRASPMPEPPPCGGRPRFGGVHAVSDVDLEVRPGERPGDPRPQRAGKTTLFNLISGEFRPDGGNRRALRPTTSTALPARKSAPHGPLRAPSDLAPVPRLTVEDNPTSRALVVVMVNLRLLPSKR
jgi:branched-chain amino acid transport system ATP-binding protein